MQKQIIQQSEIKLVGIKIRTSLQQEMNIDTAKISAHWNRYIQKNIPSQIANCINPLVTYAAYTNYTSDEYGEYDFFIGQEVSILDSISADLSSLIVPANKYLKLTTEAGKMPIVIIDAWQQIWQMKKENQLGAQRIYQVDFEVYDQRALDPNNTVMDIYLGIK